MAALSVEDLIYDGRPALSFCVPAGHCWAVMGPSGGGKTRLLRALVDLDPQQGRVVAGAMVLRETGAPLWRRNVVLVPAQARWWFDKVAPHFGGRGWSTLVGEGILGLSPAMGDRAVAELSSGEKQRLALLRALALEPEVLLLDEPSANLDEENVGAMERLVTDYCRTKGASVLWVTHDRGQARRVANRVLWVDAGGAGSRARDMVDVDRSFEKVPR